MERIEVTAYPNSAEAVEQILKEFEVPYFRAAGKSAGVDVFHYTITAPEDMAHDLVEKLAKVIETKQMNTYITNEKVEATVSDYLQRLAEKVSKKKKVAQVVEELIPLTEPFIRFRKDMLIMIVIASMVALSGLFGNNPAVVIGAMLISPLIGPITAFSFNAAVGHPTKMKHAAFSGFILVVAVVGAAAVATMLASLFMDLPITNEILLRTSTSPIDVGIAILLGMAGGIAMVSAIPGILVGVAIAAALVPPATVTGIGIAMLDEKIFTGALLLTSSNIIGLLLGCMIVFFIRGISPRKYYEKEQARKYIIFTILVFVGLSVLLGIFSIVD